MHSSLDTLAKNLPKNNFVYIDSHFCSHSEEEKDLLRQKGYFPYSYITSFEKYDEPELPARHLWKNKLQGNEISVTEREWKHARNVFSKFNCSNIGEYSDLYLTCDTLILACVFEHFRKVCFDTYSVDCAQYYTASNLSGDAFLRVCKADIELLTVREHLDIAEAMLRGGISSVFSKKLSQANNKFVEGFDNQKPSTFLWLIDANNLYGGIMEKYPLPLNNFIMASSVTLQKVLETEADSEVGYIVEVDIEYPQVLHEAHSDFPLAPTKEIIKEEWLSNDQRNFLIENDIPIQSKVKKLIQTMYPKKNYTLHYLTLQLYVQLGLKVTEVHRVLQFNQAKWLKPYIELNTDKRKRAQNKFEEDFYKLLSKSAYGKTCEGKRNRINVQITQAKSKLSDLASCNSFNGVKIIDEKLLSVATKNSKVMWDKPTIVGSTILDLAKCFMYNFHFNVIKPNFECKLLYSDTDSFLYEIVSEDLFEDLAKNIELKKHFDFSNYAEDHVLFHRSQKKETLKFKDEMGGKLIKEFVCLKQKLCSILAEGE